MKTQRKNTVTGPQQRRRHNHRLEDAERFFAPSGVVELPDWLIGAD